jgi:hypothetical protein
VTPSAGQILLNNYYGWFERIEKGVYGLSDTGIKALETWRAIVDHPRD